MHLEGKVGSAVFGPALVDHRHHPAQFFGIATGVHPAIAEGGGPGECHVRVPTDEDQDPLAGTGHIFIASMS